jgi:hypothetical protein
MDVPAKGWQNVAEYLVFEMILNLVVVENRRV